MLRSLRPVLLGVAAMCTTHPVWAESPSSDSLSLVVMDPLAAPLSCPCVEGYAQRQYEKLADYLTEQLGRKVTISFGESLKGALEKGEVETAHVVVGKDSVVRADASKIGQRMLPVAQLTGKDGATTQTGLIVVPSGDSTRKVEDLGGYRILYGPPECDEKFAAPRQLLEDAGIAVVAAEQAETSAACSDGACKIIEWGDAQNAAAVISSYAAPLLEGCGTINKGDLRVVGETKPVPFVTAFVNAELPKSDRQAIRKALLAVMDHPELMLSLETLRGFVPLSDDYRAYYQQSTEPTADAAPSGTGPPGVGAAEPPPPPESQLGWTGWRGPHRDGRVRALPTRLPEKMVANWEVPLAHAGLGGIAATDKLVVIGDRNLDNTGDEFRCYDAATGDLLWMVDYPADGHLDYDNTPRATPLVINGELGARVYLLGAFGHLTCADLATGLVYWQKNLRDEFQAEHELVWGMCSSPLIAGGNLIVNPGAPEASIVALEPMLGTPEWQTPGHTTGYGSLTIATLGGRQQLVGHDRTTLGGWDIKTGERLWTLTPPRDGDFNVPTPIEVDGKLLVTTEGNATRLYAFDDDGRIVDEPVAVQPRLAPDMSTPVVVGRRLFCVCGRLYCLDLDNDLAVIWEGDDDAFGDYAPIIADDKHLLILGHGGELLLVDALADRFRVVDREFLFDDDATREAELYSHPAIVGQKLFVRGEAALASFDLD